MDELEFDSILRKEVNQYICSERGESAAFLIWYLKNFFRIDEQEAIDCVCDQSNDKGIDGIYVDDDEEAVYLFQSKFSPELGKAQGDNDIRNFIGAKAWFHSASSIKELLQSTANPLLKSLVEGLKLEEKMLYNYNVFLQFITNKNFDSNALEYLKINSELSGFDFKLLYKKYTYAADGDLVTGPTNIGLSNNSKINYNLPDGTLARVYAIRAKELLKLHGIQDRTLFYKNVRYGLGRTRVNKDIQNTLLKQSEHNNFFLYNNGITLICGSIDESMSDQLIIDKYAVINGCQSLLTLYENAAAIDENTYVLTKVIKIDITSPLVQKITYYTNNQNSISLIDLKSNDRVQKELKKEFSDLLNGSVVYRIKRGEGTTNSIDIIDIDFAAQLIEAFFYHSPQNTHLKSTLFGERYFDIFSRNIDAAKIYLAYLTYKTIENNSSELKTEQIRNYGLALFFFTNLISELLKDDELGEKNSKRT